MLPSAVGLSPGHNSAALTVHLRQTALYVYERVITLDEDIELVWRRRWTGVTVLYAGLHVCVIAFLMAALAGYFVVSCTVSGTFILASPVIDKQTEVSNEYHCIRSLTSSPANPLNT